MMRALTTAMFIFLLAPVVLVVPMSFSGDAVMSFPPTSWSTTWYSHLLHDTAMIDAFETSLLLGAAATALSLAIALPAAYIIARRKPRGAAALYQLLTAPLLLPTIVLGLALLILLAPPGCSATSPACCWHTWS